MTLFNEWSEQIRGYNRNVKLSFLANILTQIGLGIFMVIYNFYIRELGFNELVNGKVISVTALATALILIPAGILSDKVGRKKLMLFGAVSTGMILLARSLVEDQSLLILFAFGTGLASAFIQVSIIPWLAENSKAEQRVHLFSIYFATMTAAHVVGSLLGGTLTDLFDHIMPSLDSIRYTLIIGTFLFISGVFPLMKLTELPLEKKIPQKKNIYNGMALHKNSLKIIALFAGAQLMIGFGAGLVIPYLNLYFADRFQASNTVIGLVISLGQGATALAMIVGPIVVRRLGEVKAVVTLQLLSLPFLLLTAYTEHFWLAALGFLFRQALMNAGNPIQMSLMMEKVDDSMKGFANSVNQMVFNLGWALMGPLSTGIVYQYGSYWGYAIVFTVTAGLYLFGSIYFYIVFQKLNKTTKSGMTQTKLA